MKIEIDETQEEFLFEALKDAKVSMIQMQMRAVLSKADPRLLSYYEEKLTKYNELEQNLADQINKQRS